MTVGGGDIAATYSADLLRDLGANVTRSPVTDKGNAVNRWRESGLENLTGYPERALSQCPVPVAEYADGALQALGLLASNDLSSFSQGADLTTVRAALTGNTRQGSISAGGSCRLIPCKDGTLALNLCRDSDWELLDAWLLCEIEQDWPSVQNRVRELPKEHLLHQGHLLGLAVADCEPTLQPEGCWFQVTHRGTSVTRSDRSPRVIDLSSLWAGPLCSRLLQQLGAEVIKVESSQRPDGARLGSKEFFQFLNAGKIDVALNLHEEHGVAELLELIQSADIVIEASRPRALRQMGIIAEELVADITGLTWIGISGYGRNEPMANWIAYGDDAAVAGGLSAEVYRASGEWMFCGDAIADPLTGIHAALAAYASWLSGGGHLLSLSLVETIQHCVTTRTNPGYQ